MDHIKLLKEAVGELRNISIEFPCSQPESTLQAEIISRLRVLWSSLPNSRLKEAQRAAFIEAMIGEYPSDEHLELGAAVTRGRRLSSEELLAMEAKQNGRCALCGVLLSRQTEPHIDHIIPVSLGGPDEIENFQILCGRCNLGKAGSLHWLMLSPFFDERPGNEPSAGLRYAVLQRHQGRCNEPSCDMDSASGELFVVPRVPIADGGRVIFDNLIVYCESHRDSHQEALYKKIRAQMKYGGKIQFGF